MNFTAVTAEDEADLVQRFFNRETEGGFVEVGAHDGAADSSQTWHLEQLGWRGILVEPQSSLAEKLKVNRPTATVIQAACCGVGASESATFYLAEISGFSGLQEHVDDQGIQYTGTETVMLRTLDDIIEEASLSVPLRFVSIDTEGTELEVLKGFTLEKNRPELVLIEDKMHDFSKHRHMVTHGYRLVKRTFMNNWYIPADRPFTLRGPLEPLFLWRKMVLGMPSRRFRRWRHSKKRQANAQN